jgi:hypothetical protein
MRSHALADHCRPWRAALVPNMAARLTTYTSAAHRARAEPAASSSAAPAGSEARNATWWSRPRRRGLVGLGCGMG